MRKTPLARRTPLRAAAIAATTANTTLARSAGLKPRSRKRSVAMRERRAFVAAFLPGRQCEARLEGCWGKATDCHEYIPRSHGGSILPDAKAKAQGQKFIGLCRPCHSRISDDTAMGRRLRLIA